ncbi:MAG: FUSC family protein [Actinomycetota bacterium]|nr:FUSC family protein [Actinomycetota bacterium]
MLLADLSGVQHGFWVVFGTLAVLRSNALSTGQNIVRAMAGIIAGLIIGGVLVHLIGTNTAVLWALLPLVILIAGLAPATISLAAGQAAFTVTLLILVPAGWKIGLLRIEDVAHGEVSLAVGLLFWPRGAAADLGRTLSEAYAVSARYLADAVAYGVSRRGSLCGARELLSAAEHMTGWYDQFAGSLIGVEAVPHPLAPDHVADGRLVEAVAHDLRDSDGNPTATRGPGYLDRRPSRRRTPASGHARRPGASRGRRACPVVGKRDA